MQLPVQRPANLETTSLGAAFAAGIGAGFWSREWVLRADQAQLDAATVFEPQVQPLRQRQGLSEDRRIMRVLTQCNYAKDNVGLADGAEVCTPSGALGRASRKLIQ